MLAGYILVYEEELNAHKQIETLIKIGVDLRRIYQDKVENGIRNTEKLDKMLDEIREGDIVVVTELIRLGRNTKELLETVEKIGLRRCNIISLKEDWFNTTKSSGAVIYEVLSGIVKFETEIEELEASNRNRKTEIADEEKSNKSEEYTTYNNEDQSNKDPNNKEEIEFAVKSKLNNSNKKYQNQTIESELNSDTTNIEQSTFKKSKANTKIIEEHTNTGGRPRKQSKDVDKAIELYRDHKLSVKEIKELTGVSKATLYRYLKGNY